MSGRSLGKALAALAGLAMIVGSAYGVQQVPPAASSAGIAAAANADTAASTSTSTSTTSASTSTSTAAIAAADTTLIEKGRYLSIAADCAACHTAPEGGKPFAGGLSIQSPLGAIVASNITPSTTAGIGSYTEAQFAHALRQGIRADGKPLYPAMPYTAYTQLTDDDTHALYVYFMQGVQPVDTKAADTGLPFPFDIRESMHVWNLMFLDDRRFAPDASQNDQVNRGAYLANALAHCSTCHTPRNELMAERVGSRFLAGGQVGAWYAPNITPDASGIGGWSVAELEQYLRAGHVAGKAQAGGPMAEAVEKSFQYLKDEDVSAIVAYIKSVPPLREGGDATPTGDATPAFSRGEARSDEPTLRGASGPNEQHSLTTGAALFSGNCASCHQPNGAGSRSPDGVGDDNQLYPSLFHNTATGGNGANNLVATMLFGIERTVGGKQVSMPRFDVDSPTNPLSDVQIADIANHVLTTYGNPAVQVTEADVAQTRAGGPKPLLAKVQPVMAPLAIGVPVLVVLLLIAFLVMRKRRSASRTSPIGN